MVEAQVIPPLKVPKLTSYGRAEALEVAALWHGWIVAFPCNIANSNTVLFAVCSRITGQVCYLASQRGNIAVYT